MDSARRWRRSRLLDHVVKEMDWFSLDHLPGNNDQRQCFSESGRFVFLISYMYASKMDGFFFFGFETGSFCINKYTLRKVI